MDASAVNRRWGGDGATVPHKQLAGYQRVTLSPGESTTVTFDLTAELLSTVDARGTRHILPGTYSLLLTRGHGEELLLRVQVILRVPAGDGVAERVIISTMLQ